MPDQLAPEFQTLDLRECVRLAPAIWFGTKRSAVVSCYQTLRTPSSNPHANIFVALSLENVVAFAFDGSINYWSASGGRMSATPGIGLRVHAGEATRRQSEVGTWLILVTPSYGHSPERRLAEAATHCALLYGRVMLHRRLVQMTVDIEDIARCDVHTLKLMDGPYSAFGSYMEAQPPLATLEAEFRQYRQGLEQLSSACAKRVRLALCWYERSIHTSSGIEAFLNL